MKKVLAIYKGLPREVKMLVAMAGLGTPFGAIYMMKRYLFPGMSTLMIILIVAGAIAAIGLIAFLVTRFLGAGKRKRQMGMANDFAAEGTGPSGMEVRAAIKANNEKFFAAIRDMRKDAGLSVYDLPWYIVIGDSGCGKTKLVNEGGLTFSTGKPQNYQLGTLNYNWWFTEDAIFIDMAGRLCNPRDDGDRNEWEAFLGAVAKGRRGFPINGALVCVSADHLLQDSPEKIEQDANTTLERLRDLQNKLGVTFATYLIVTKCDKVVGFMQFFDRAERDITYKNQVFGWSKPGTFNELYDPEAFSTDFESLYARLHDLRLRRLHDDVDEVDLGLAYSFPEEFREIEKPLQTYVRTLFPQIKNPRAVKNLIFRGVYFTSATQEGALILKHLTERLGGDVAGQFPTLDLYPNKRPHFIKDLLLRKVLPEHGLVFRSEEQALRNRKLTKLLQWGGSALFLVLATTFGLSAWKFGNVIGAPRARATAARPDVERPPLEALKVADELGGDTASLRANIMWANLLSLFVGADQPIHDLNTIRASLFERHLLRQSLVDISTALRTRKLTDPRAGEQAIREGEAFLKALEQYVLWYGCAGADTPPDGLTYSSFETLAKVVTDKSATMVMYRESFESQAAAYFEVRAKSQTVKSPARLLRDRSMDPSGTILAALRTAHEYLDRFAALDEKHPDPLIAEWMRLRQACATIESSYGRMLDAARQLPATLQQFEAFNQVFVTDYQAFSDSLAACTWKGETGGIHTVIGPIRPAILAQRQKWLDYQGSLERAYGQCRTGTDEAVFRAIAALSTGSDEAGLPGLDRTLWEHIKSLGLTERNYGPQWFESFNDDSVVREVPSIYQHILQFEPGGGTKSDVIRATPDATTVGGRLKTIRNALVAGGGLETGTPADWIAALDELFDRPGVAAAPQDIERLATPWRPDELKALYAAHLDLVAAGAGRRLLETMYARMDSIGPWGFAQLAPGWNEGVPSGYQIALPRTTEAPATTKRREETPARDESRRRSGRRSGGRPSPSESRSTVAPTARDRVIPACATRTFLSKRADECADLLNRLRDFKPKTYYFDSEADDRPLNEQCIEKLRGAGRIYMDEYVRSWSQAYGQRELSELDRLQKRADDWPALADIMRGSGGARGASGEAVADELRGALSEVLEALPFWDWFFDEQTNKWVAPDITGDRDWAEVAGWMQTALENSWSRDFGRFVVEAVCPKDGTGKQPADAPPWDAIAGEFFVRWEELAQAMARRQIPAKFDSDLDNTTLEGIPWSAIERLRERARLDDERLTGLVVSFQEKSQGVLSRALSKALFEIQRRELGDRTPFDGWPYLPGDDYGANALDTVAFAEFKSFVTQVERAWVVLEELEKGLPDRDAFRQDRLVVYRLCREWIQFMGIDNSLTPDALQVVVEVGDPVKEPLGKERPEDTPQMYYDAIVLDLGLAVGGGGNPMEDVLRIPTLAEQRQGKKFAGSWKWDTRSENRELKVSLVDGRRRAGASRAYPDLMIPLGEASPLALCAYLHRHGIRNGEEWVSSHMFDLVKRFKEKGVGDLAGTLDPERTKVGVKFLFDLGRPMPEPIPRIGVR